jgi:phosphate transporter
MKFGKQLETSANAEWREYYVQYKRLKRLIKRVAFEVEKHSTKQEKRKKKKDKKAKGAAGNDASSTNNANNATDASIQVVVDEQSPLLANASLTPLVGSGVGWLDVQQAEREFWDVTNDNLKIVNDFFVGKIISLRKDVKDFEEGLASEQESHGHVHAARGRNHSMSQRTYAGRRVWGEGTCGTDASIAT